MSLITGPFATGGHDSSRPPSFFRHKHGGISLTAAPGRTKVPLAFIGATWLLLYRLLLIVASASSARLDRYATVFPLRQGALLRRWKRRVRILDLLPYYIRKAFLRRCRFRVPPPWVQNERFGIAYVMAGEAVHHEKVKESIPGFAALLPQGLSQVTICVKNQSAGCWQVFDYTPQTALSEALPVDWLWRASVQGSDTRSRPQGLSQVTLFLYPGIASSLAP